MKDETISVLNDGENYFPIQYECISTEKEPVDCGRVESEFKGAMENALKGELEKTPFAKVDYDVSIREDVCCCYLVISRPKGEGGTKGRLMTASINFATVKGFLKSLEDIFKRFRDDLLVFHSYTFRSYCNPQRKDIVAFREGWEQTCRDDCRCTEPPL